MLDTVNMLAIGPVKMIMAVILTAYRLIYVVSFASEVCKWMTLLLSNYN